MVSDDEWITLIEEDIRNTVKNTVLGDSPIIRVSSKTGKGITELVEEIMKVLEMCPPKVDVNQPRLPVDRVFSMPGFGTVVTGTLLDGSLKVGDEIVIQPSSRKSRIRGIQNHKTKLDVVHPGQRTAINITGVSVEEVKRGDVITVPGLYPSSRRIDVKFSLLEDINGSLKHRSEVKFYHGSAEVLGSIRLLGTEELLPGSTAFLQIELADPVVTKKGDRFILRRPSPGETLGGGSIIEVASPKRFKRYSSEVLSLLENKLSGSSSEKILTLIHAESPILVSDVLKKSALDSDETLSEIKGLEDSNQVKMLVISENTPQNFLVSWQYLQSLLKKISQILKAFHQDNPLKTGMSREELRSKLKLSTRIYNLIIEDWVKSGEIMGNQFVLWLPDFKIILSAQQTLLVNRLLNTFEQNLAAPPSVKECIQETGEDLYKLLIEKGDLLQVSEDVVYSSGQISKLKEEVILQLEKNSQITVADFRDKYITSRKYALAFLEYLDRVGITRRDGDYRKLNKK
jgi:selenocysteine-specific elongation factor